MTPKTEPDPYFVLGVARTATDAEIRAAYLALVAKYHPDRHQGNPLEELAGERMAEINRAYEILSDPGRRTVYDSGGGTGPGPAGAGRPYGTAPGSISRKHIRWLQILALLCLLPLFIRFGSFLVRQLVGLVRAALEVTSLTRGTPLAAGLVLLAVAILVLVLVRQHRAKLRSQNGKPDR
jgi:hypothetical protein